MRVAKSLVVVLIAVAWGPPTPTYSAEHKIEALSEAPPSDGVSKEILDQLQTKGIKVVSGGSRTLCEIWPAKKWSVQPGFKATEQVLYPFQSGELIGLVRYRVKGGDFREQEIARGVYTLRYGQQPVDGNHVGTSPTRDFLLLVPADKDKSVKPLDEKALFSASAEAAGSKHPAILCLRKAPEDAKDLPAIIHEESHDWWCLRLTGKGEAGGKTVETPIDFVIVGHAEE
jgi:hypothetical protein